MSDKPFESANRIFTSPDPSSTASLSYSVYAQPGERRPYASVSVMAGQEYLFYIDMAGSEDGTGPEFDYVKTFDNIIDFFKEARDQAMAAERFLDEHSNG